MTQRGGAKHHRERMGEAIREEIAALLGGELADPRIGLVSINEVQLAPDGHSVRVYLAIDGDDNEVARSLEGLNAARGYIRRELGARLRLRQAPEIFFSPDRSQQHAARVDALLERLKRQNR